MIKYPVVIPAFGIGTVIINLFSPFAGALELVFMPLVDVTGGVLCYLVGGSAGRSEPTSPHYSTPSTPPPASGWC